MYNHCTYTYIKNYNICIYYCCTDLCFAFLLEKTCSISSKDFPLVSGMNMATNTAKSRHDILNIQNTPHGLTTAS